MLEIAGLVVSGFGLINDLFSTHRDVTSWNEEILEVDREWLSLAIAKGILEGREEDYAWVDLRKVPSLELKESHKVVVAHNDDKKIIYRLIRGRPHDHVRLVLMKKAARE